MRRSAGLMSGISASGSSGITATVQAEVWIRPLRFGGRHTLHAMAAGFKFQPTVNAVAADLGDHLFKAAVLTFRWRWRISTCQRRDSA